MYKKKIFLPKTNMSIVDSIFRQFFNFLLSSGAKGGKYLTSWSEALDGNQFKNLIFQNLQISFIVHYSNTEFQSDLKTLLKEDPFPDLFEIADVFKINFFATIFNKQSLLKETDDIIREIPKSDQILSKLILFNNLKNTADENELNLLDGFIEKEKINFSENYEDCIKKSYSYCILPSYILSIFNEKKLHYIYSHYMILYLLDVGNSFVTENECLEILSHFDQISYNDACELNSMFNTQEFLSKFKSKIQNKPNFLHFEGNKTLLDDILEKLNRSLELNEQIENSFDQNDKEFNKAIEEKQQKFNHIIDEIENEQKIIELLNP